MPDAQNPLPTAENGAPSLSGVFVTDCTHCGDPIKRINPHDWVHTDSIGFENFGEACDWQPIAAPRPGVIPPGECQHRITAGEFCAACDLYDEPASVTSPVKGDA